MSKRPVIRVGVSACLLGEPVRHDGGHKRDATLLESLGPLVQWVPVCPEMAIGLGVPREPVRLVTTTRGVRMISESGLDHTHAMERWARANLDELERLRLHGFVLKSKSPSCGVFGVKLHDARGDVLREDARGLFARELIERFKTLPVEEEERLHDPRIREDFIGRAFAFERRLRSVRGRQIRRTTDKS